MKSRYIALLFLTGLASVAGAMRLDGPASPSSGSNPRGMAAGDLDGDGVNELVVANFGAPTLIGQVTGAPAGSLSVFKHQDGALVPAYVLEAGKSPRSVAVSDLNGDGKQDLVATFYDEGALGVYLQQAGGGFGAYAKVNTGKHPVGLSVLEVFGTKLVAAANYDSNTVSLFKVGRDGGLTLLAEAASGGNPTDVELYAPASGGASLIIANYGTHSISIYPIEKDYSLGARQDIALSGNPCKLVLEDLDGDGREDLSVALFSENKIAVYYQKPSGFMGDPEKASLSGLHPNGLSSGRISGAPLPWLVAADRDSDVIDLLKRGGDGKLTVTASLLVKEGTGGSEYGPVEVLAADLNGDGRTDVVATHMRSGKLKVFLQKTPLSPVISSATHPDPEKFFTSSSLSVHLQAGVDLDGVEKFLVGLDQLPSTLPVDGKAQVAISDLMFSNLATGTHYVHGRGVDVHGNLGEAAHFKVGVTAEMDANNTYNYPNPSRDGRTTIRFPLASPTDVKIRVFDEMSNLVWSRDLAAAECIAGVNSVLWDGHNDKGQPVGNGGYILTVSADGKTVTKKIAIVR